jgi:hypothetical protein
MKPPKLPLALTIIGLLLIAFSVLWSQVLFPLKDVDGLIDEDRLQELEQAMLDGREHFSDVVETDVPPEELASKRREAQRIHDENQAYVNRWQFLRTRVPGIIRLVGVVCAAIGCVLYPILILRRKREAAVSIFE